MIQPVSHGAAAAVHGVRRSLNGRIQQVVQIVEGKITFHTARSTAYPQPAPGEGAGPGTFGPLKVRQRAGTRPRDDERVGAGATAITDSQRQRFSVLRRTASIAGLPSAKCAIETYIVVEEYLSSHRVLRATQTDMSSVVFRVIPREL
jgi:hypothetical protein